MKKTAMFVLAFVFLLGATCAIAKAANGNKDLSRPIEVKAGKVKLFGKKTISNSEREKGNALEQMIIKGAKTATPAPPTTDPTAGGVTGVLGVLPNGGQKYAIVIGLSNYPGTSESTTDKILPDLCKIQVPDNDPSVYAQSDGTYATLDDEIKANCKDGDSVNMEHTLLTKYGFAPSNVVRLSDSIATFSKIEEEVMKLVGGTITHEDGITTTYESKLTKDDELVFFFSGHDAMTTIDVDNDGEADDGGIVVYDEKYDAAKYIDTATKYPDPINGPYDNYKAYYDSTGYNSSAYIWDGQLKAWFENSPTKRIFFAFDTCNAAEMDDLKEAVDPTVNGVGRVMAFSSGKNQSSYTYYLGGANNSGNIHDGEGLFSHYFVLRAMHDGLADGSNPLRKTDPLKKDGKVAVEEAFSYAYPLVRTASSYRQTPVLNDYFTNDLLP